MRHLLPMNEFESAILSFFPLVPVVPFPPPPLSLPPPHAATAVASTTASPATRTQRPVLRNPSTSFTCTGAAREPGHGAAPGCASRSSDLSPLGEANGLAGDRQARRLTGAARPRRSPTPD